MSANIKKYLLLTLMIILALNFPELFLIKHIYCQPIPPKIEGVELIQTVLTNKNSLFFTKTTSYNYMCSIGITNELFHESVAKLNSNSFSNIRARMVWLNMVEIFKTCNVPLIYHKHVFLQIWCDNINYHFNLPFTHNPLLEDNFMQWKFKIDGGIENQFLTSNLTLSNKPLNTYNYADLTGKKKLMYLNQLINRGKFLKNVLMLTQNYQN